MKGFLIFVFFGFMLMNRLELIDARSCPDVATVDLNITRYLGIWYEIATTESMHDVWEYKCECTYANYTLDKQGVAVSNGCRRGSVDAPYTFAEGQAIVPDPSQPGKLAVRFSDESPYAPYWVIVLDPDYTEAVVWSCDNFFGKEIYFMWVLARTPTISQADYTALTQKASQITGVDAANVLIPTIQQGCPAI